VQIISRILTLPAWDQVEISDRTIKGRVEARHQTLTTVVPGNFTISLTSYAYPYGMGGDRNYGFILDWACRDENEYFAISQWASWTSCDIGRCNRAIRFTRWCTGELKIFYCFFENFRIFVKILKIILNSGIQYSLKMEHAMDSLCSKIENAIAQSAENKVNLKMRITVIFWNSYDTSRFCHL